MTQAPRESRYKRLTATDLLFLRLETDAWPCHFGGFAILEGGNLFDDSGRLRLGEIRNRLERRLSHVPELRRRIHHPGLLGGRPLWVDDDHFDIARHVYHAVAEPSGDHAGLLAKATELYERRLDRSRPLWELWLLTCSDDDRVGVLLKLHHAVADGIGAVAILGYLFDTEPGSIDPAPVSWTPEPAPRRRDLLTDHLAAKTRSLRRILTAVAHPFRAGKSVAAFVKMTGGYFGKRAAAAGSLNQPVQAGRLVQRLRLDLATIKDTAHAHDGKVNDVVLTLWAGGLRHLLISRGEPVSGVELITGMAATLRSRTDAGSIENRVGTMVLPLPISEPEPGPRLGRIISTTREAKTSQRPMATMGYLAGLAATPIGRYFTAHQTASNTIVTNVIGPTFPVYLLGARVIEVLPIIELVGNIGLTLAAFSYDGQMHMVVTADATGFPDLAILMDGMERDWRHLSSGSESG